MKNENEKKKENMARVVGSAHAEAERATASAVLPDSLNAAAPDLLAALKAYVRACHEQGILLGAITGDAEAAIAKAEGR